MPNGSLGDSHSRGGATAAQAVCAEEEGLGTLLSSSSLGDSGFGLEFYN